MNGEILLYCWRLCYLIVLCVMVLVQELRRGGMGDEFDWVFTVIFYRFNETPGRAEENGGIA